MSNRCCVCSYNFSLPCNNLCVCENCTISVHEGCYGIQKSGVNNNWFCRKCESQVRMSKIRCDLCPIKEGAFKRSTGIRCGKNVNSKTEVVGWVHVLCALYISEVSFSDYDSMDLILLDGISSDRFGRSCVFCERNQRSSQANYGVCIQCAWKNCKLYFHVSCAALQGLLSDLPAEKASTCTSLAKVLHANNQSSQSTSTRKLDDSQTIPATPSEQTQYGCHLYGFCSMQHKKKYDLSNTVLFKKTSNDDLVDSTSYPTQSSNPSTRRRFSLARHPPTTVTNALGLCAPEEQEKPLTPIIDDNRSLKSDSALLDSFDERNGCELNGAKRLKLESHESNSSVHDSVEGADSIKAEQIIKGNMPHHDGPNLIFVSEQDCPILDRHLEITSTNIESNTQEDTTSYQMRKLTVTTCADNDDLVSTTVKAKSCDLSPNNASFGESTLLQSTPVNKPNEQSASSTTTTKCMHSNMTKTKRRTKDSIHSCADLDGVDVPITKPTFSPTSASVTDSIDPKVPILDPNNLPLVLPRRPLSLRGLGLVCNSKNNTVLGPVAGLYTTNTTSTNENINQDENENSTPPYLATMHDLLEWQWDQTSALLMQQAEGTDVVSLLDCLHQLKSENDILEAKLVRLNTRHEHLRSVNARLSASLATMESAIASSSPKLELRVGQSIPDHLTTTSTHSLSKVSQPFKQSELSPNLPTLTSSMLLATSDSVQTSQKLKNLTKNQYTASSTHSISLNFPRPLSDKHTTSSECLPNSVKTVAITKSPLILNMGTATATTLDARSIYSSSLIKQLTSSTTLPDPSVNQLDTPINQNPPLFKDRVDMNDLEEISARLNSAIAARQSIVDKTINLKNTESQNKYSRSKYSRTTTHFRDSSPNQSRASPSSNASHSNNTASSSVNISSNKLPCQSVFATLNPTVSPQNVLGISTALSSTQSNTNISTDAVFVTPNVLHSKGSCSPKLGKHPKLTKVCNSNITTVMETAHPTSVTQ